MSTLAFKNISEIQKYWEKFLYTFPFLTKVVVTSAQFNCEITLTWTDGKIKIVTIHQ